MGEIIREKKRLKGGAHGCLEETDNLKINSLFDHQTKDPEKGHLEREGTAEGN